MAIIKQAKNIKINVNKDYFVKAGTITEISDKINIESFKENLSLNSNKQILQKGLDGGVKHNNYTSPEVIVEKSEYKLESTYAHEQLMSIAEELGEVTFMMFMSHTFGYEIEVESLSKLYRALSDKKIESPEIVVSKCLVGWRNGLAGYSNKRKKIIVNEKFVADASTDNDKRAELLAALVEEYGHHIDNLLRTDFSTEGVADTDIIDDGAKFAYQLFKFDIFKESKLNYAKADFPKFKGDLIVDFSILHKKVIEYVNEDRHYSEDPAGEISNYGAGRNRKKNKNAAFAHGDIEFEGLSKIYKQDIIQKIYYGNWLRDMSQVIVKITVRLTNGGIKVKKITGKINPVKFSHNTWVQLMKILAIKEFVYDPKKDAGNPLNDDYKTLEAEFVEKFGDLTKDILGIYRPEEHIDNPYKLDNDSKTKDDKGRIISFKYNNKDKTLYSGDNNLSWKIDPKKNMSNFFWVDYGEDRPSSVTYMKEQITLACALRGSKEGYRHLGAALHVLEDFFSHTNFVEVSLRRLSVNAYPWVSTCVNEKDNTKIPIVSGRFLVDDTIASVGPKAGDLLFAPEIKEYKRRVPGQRTLSEKFTLSILEDLAKAQDTDYVENNKSYLGITYSTWLSWYNDFLNFQDFLASEYIKADGQKWNSKDFFEKLGAKSAETFQKSAKYLGESLTFFPKLAFNLLLGSLDEVVPEAQSHLIKNYGVNPSHSQIAKDSYSHPLNKISATLAKHAVEDVGTKYNSGMDGTTLKNYVANTYFVHPSSPNAKWVNEKYLKDWVRQNPLITKELYKHTIYEDVEQKAKNINDKSIKQMRDIIEYFNKKTQ